MDRERIARQNRRIFTLLSEYINFMPDAVTPEMIRETKELCLCTAEEAFRILISGILDIYEDKELRQGWISKMFSCLEREKYENDPYRKKIRLPAVVDGEWEITKDRYKPYEVFVFNDPKTDGEGRLIPQIGFFEEEYVFPVVKQSGREWMLITPNEIETMREPVARAFGHVITYGLGLGYFAFMASEKEEVRSVTVVERDESVIRLFKKHILPLFPNKEKINIVLADALEFAKGDYRADFVFADIWHDPSDGCDLYLKLKALEKDGIDYAYWIEDTIKLYL